MPSRPVPLCQTIVSKKGKKECLLIVKICGFESPGCLFPHMVHCERMKNAVLHEWKARKSSKSVSASSQMRKFSFSNRSGFDWLPPVTDFDRQQRYSILTLVSQSADPKIHPGTTQGWIQGAPAMPPKAKRGN